jgi:peptidoglycan biosynthesis protein MviN/MurJ (putative lipid II flippase)
MPQRVRNTINTIGTLLTREQTEIIKIASILIIPAILTKITGHAVSLILAATYGTKGDLNLFLIASAFPELIANILLFGVVGAVLIPILVEIKEKKGEKDFLEFYSGLFSLIVLLFSIVAIIMIVFADVIIPYVLAINYPGERLEPEKLQTIIMMMRVLFVAADFAFVL